MNLLEIRRDPDADPGGARLESFLNARFALEHAARRRSYLAHLTALAGALVWLYAALASLRAIRILALGAFAVLFAGLIVSVTAEIRLRFVLRRIRDTGRR